MSNRHDTDNLDFRQVVQIVVTAKSLASRAADHGISFDDRFI